MDPPLSDLPNLGPRSCEWLAGIGIRTVAELQRMGPVPAYLALKRARRSVSLNMLYALVGAVEGVHWVEVKRERRLELLLQLEDAGRRARAGTAAARRRRD